MNRARAIELGGSGRGAPLGASVAGEPDPDALLSLTLHFRRRTPPPPPGSAEDLRRLEPMTHRALERQRARTHARAAERVAAFARDHGVAVRDMDLTRRRMILEAPARLLTELFGATVKLYRDEAGIFQARTGVLRIPFEIAPWTRAVVGFDRRPILRAAAASDAAGGLWPTEVAARYGIPLNHDMSGQCVGIIAVGGGYQKSDLANALDRMGRKPPTVVDQPVGGATNQFTGGASDSEIEIALDLQVLASLLPSGRIVVYFTANTAEALADAIDQAVRHEVNRPHVLSISWGSPEFYWTEPRREVVCATLCDAARLQISVVTAAGDQLATCDMTDGKAHVWFPASSPYVLGCGGTATTAADLSLQDESAWNEGTIGTGGGISDVYPVPAFQFGIGLPASVNDGHNGRGVPDVAALAATFPGYRIVVGGAELTKFGTSAATPLWAGLIAVANAARGAPLGLVTPHFYGVPGLTRPITIGNNQRSGIGYPACAGWNACTGLGVPRGAEIIAALAPSLIV